MFHIVEEVDRVLREICPWFLGHDVPQNIDDMKPRGRIPVPIFVASRVENRLDLVERLILDLVVRKEIAVISLVDAPLFGELVF
jgi:hypothetical protein